MNIWLSLFFSLFLTTLVSFATPVVFFSLILATLVVVSHVPLISIWGTNLYEQVWNFLAVFGEGSATIGLLTIAVACAIVGFLFESLNFYRYRILIKQPINTSWHKKAPEMISKITNYRQ
jgi:FlaA1/EpsC-like NDP-sugar epimerase